MTRRQFALFFSLFCATPLTTRFAVTQPLPDRVPLDGVVVDTDNKPVPDAIVTIRRQEDIGITAFWGAEARTDSRGKFAFPLAEEGRYYFSFEAPGFAAVQTFPFEWRAGAERPKLQLSRLVVLPLLLLSPTGDPLRNESLFIRLRGDGTAGQTLMRPKTDNNGMINIPNLTPATYSVFIASRSGYDLESGLNLVYERSPKIKQIKLNTGASVSAVTRDAQGRFLGGAQLSLVPQSPAESTRLAGPVADPGEDYALLAAGNDRPSLVTRDGDGTLKLGGIPPGKYVARLALPGYGVAPSQDVELRAGENFTFDVGFPTRKAATLNLQLNDNSGRPITSTEFALRLIPIAADGTMRDEPDAIPDGIPDLQFITTGAGGRRVFTDSQGQATLYPLKPGRYRIFASRRNPLGGLVENPLLESPPHDVQITLPQGDKPGETVVLAVP